MEKIKERMRPERGIDNIDIVRGGRQRVAG